MSSFAETAKELAVKSVVDNDIVLEDIWQVAARMREERKEAHSKEIAEYRVVLKYIDALIRQQEAAKALGITDKLHLVLKSYEAESKPNKVGAE